MVFLRSLLFDPRRIVFALPVRRASGESSPDNALPPQAGSSQPVEVVATVTLVACAGVLLLLLVATRQCVVDVLCVVVAAA